MTGAATLAAAGALSAVALSPQDSPDPSSTAPKPRAGAPNILLIVLDDVGFADRTRL